MVNIKRKKLPTQEDIINFLDSCYDKCLNNTFSKSISELAEDYLSKHNTREEACKAMLKNQITKCTTSGVVTGFGGIVTMPITLPSNIGSVIYMQMRMIACTAYMGGYDL